MSTRISSAQREVAHRRDLFIASYATTGNATSAAIAAGFGEKNAGAQGDKLLHEPETGTRAREARERHVLRTQDAFSRQQAALCAAADGAIATLVQVASNPPRVGAQAMVLAAVAILDRAGHKPVERVEQHIAWADITAELQGVDIAQVLQEALLAISQSSGALPGPGDG